MYEQLVNPLKFFFTILNKMVPKVKFAHRFFFLQGELRSKMKREKGTVIQRVAYKINSIVLYIINKPFDIFVWEIKLTSFQVSQVNTVLIYTFIHSIFAQTKMST